MTNDFSGWSQERFESWLQKNHPKPPSRWVELTYRIHHEGLGIFELTMADEYEICIDVLAHELSIHARDPIPALADMPEEPIDFLIRPARRRKKKQMWLRTPQD